MAENRCQSTVTIQQNEEVSSFLGPIKEEPGQSTDLHRMCENEQFVELGKNIKTIPPFQECQQDNSEDLHHTYIKKEHLETETVKVAGPSVSGSLDIRTLQNVGTQEQQRNIQNPSIKLSPQSPGPAHSSQDKTELPVQPAQTSIHMLMFPKCSQGLLFSSGLPATQNKTQSCQRPLPTQPAQTFQSEETETKHSLQGLQIQKNYLPMQNMATNLDETAIGIIKQENEGMQYNFSAQAQIPLDTVVSGQLSVGRLHDLRNQLLLNATIQSSPSTALTESDIVLSKQKSNEGKNIACHLVIDSVQSVMSSAATASHFVFSDCKTKCLKRKNVTCSPVSNLPKKVRSSSYMSMTNSNIVGESGVARSTVNIPTGQRNSSSSSQKVKKFPCTNKAIKVDLTGGGLPAICIECNQPLSTPCHAVLKNCDLCPFSTICSSSLCGHLKYEHGLKLKLPKELNSGYNFLMECSLSEWMICICHKMWTKCCNVIANHLSECTMSKGRKTCILVSESPDRSQQTENVMDFRVNETENSDQNNAVKLECFEVADNTENQGILTEIEDILTADYIKTEPVPWQQQSEKQNDTISELEQHSGEHGLQAEKHKEFVCEGQNKTLHERQDSLSENQNDFVFEKLQQSLTENQQESAGHVSVTNNQKLHISESHTSELFEGGKQLPTGCGLCGERFKNCQVLGQHMRYFHQEKNKEVTICMGCDNFFSNLKSLKKHQISVHYGKHIIYGKFEVCISSYTFKEYCILKAKCSENETGTEFEMMYDKVLKELSVRGLTSEHIKTEFNEIIDSEISCKNILFIGERKDQSCYFLVCNVCDKQFSGENQIISILTHFYKHWHPEGIDGNKTDNLKSTLLYLTQKIKNCKFCHVKYKKSVNMSRHLKSCHVFIICRTCGKKVANKNFSGHLKTHEKNRNYLCEKCGRLFKTKLTLDGHQKNRCTLVICEVCDRAFNKSFYETHLKSHKKKVIQCLECGTRFKCAKSKRFHMRYIHNRIGKTFVICHICGKQLQQIYLTGHLRKCRNNCNAKSEEVDKSLQSLECGVCNKSFSTPSSLKTHNRRFHNHHRGEPERPRICFVCGKTLKNKSFDMARHLETHNEPSPAFHCEICNKDYKGKLHLYVHMTQVHGKRKYKCRYCGKIFTNKDQFERHEKAKHLKQKNVQCTLCNYKCFNSYMLKSHMKFRHKTVWK